MGDREEEEWTNKPEGDAWMDAWCLWSPDDDAKCKIKDTTPTAMSEPASGALLLVGLTAISFYRRRRLAK